MLPSEGYLLMRIRKKRLNRILKFCSTGVVVFFLAAGCTVGPDYQRPELKTPEEWAAAVGDREIGLTPTAEEIERWWIVFDDPVLNDLIARAGRDNLDLRMAVARVEEARAFIGVVSGQLSPRVGAGANASRQRLSEASITLPGGQTSNSFDIGVNASWEIDVFGRVRRSVEAAEGEFQATEEDRNDVLISVYAEVAQNYIIIRSRRSWT